MRKTRSVCVGCAVWTPTATDSTGDRCRLWRRELQGLRHAAPLMIELFLKELDTYRFSGGDATAVERLALVGDLLLAIGASGHPAAVYFLVDVVAHDCACCESCDPAIRALGETGSAMALPTLVDMLEVPAKATTTRVSPRR